MIKRSFIIFLAVTSCATLKIEDYRSIISELTSLEDDIDITQELIDSKRFSFAKVRIGKKEPVLMSLSAINNGLFTWISSDFVKITTKDGKIVQTSGLEYDVDILDSLIWSLDNNIKVKYLLEVQNPYAIFYQHSSITAQTQENIYLDKLYEVSYYDEEVVTNSYRWSEVNHYAVEKETGLTIWTHQHIHPYLDSIEIAFYYKY